jgi:hypothetical protein
MVRMTASFVGALFLAVALRSLATESADPTPPTSEVTAPQIDEVQVRESIKARGRSLLLAGDLQGFETLADQYRVTQERTPAGAWKLWVLYKSINTLGPGGPSDPQWTLLEPQLQDWLDHNPSSTTATIVTAKTYYEHAWVYRGNGYSRQVGSGRRQSYETFIERARAVLDAHSGVASIDPEWDTLRIAIAREQGADSSTILDMANRALERQAYYYPIHFATVNALLPQWGGSEELIQEYVQTAVRRSSAKEGTQAYAQIYFNVADKANAPLDELNLTGAKWPEMKQSLDELMRAYPDPFNIEMARQMDCFASDKSAYLALGHRAVESLPPISWWDVPARRQACDDWAFRGIVRRGSLPHRVHAYVNFLMGEGHPYWRNTGLIAALVLALVHTAMWFANGRPRTNRDRWLSSASQERLFNPTDYPRSYRVLPQVQLAGNALALLTTAVSLASVRAILRIPWGDPAETQIVVALLLLTAVLGVIFVLRSLVSRVVLLSDSIELRGRISRRQLRRDDILAKVGPYYVHGGLRLNLIPRPDRGRILNIPLVCAPDEAFRLWFETLPDVPWKDPFEPESAP